MNRICFWFFTIFLLFTPKIGFSQDHDIYNYSWKLDGPIWGTSAGLVGVSLIIDHKRGPITEAKINGLSNKDIWGFDRSATSNFSTTARKASDIFRDGVYIAPLTLLFSDKARSEYKSIIFMYAEVLAVNSSLTQFSKVAVGRLRPYAYNPNAPLELKLSKTTRRSFFSGHVSHVASISFFTASVFSDLYPESKYRYVVWAGAISAPAVTGFLRYKAGRHFPTDLMVGYGVGALVGYFIPKLHKSKNMSNFSLIGTSNGIGISYAIQ